MIPKFEDEEDVNLLCDLIFGLERLEKPLTTKKKTNKYNNNDKIFSINSQIPQQDKKNEKQKNEHEANIQEVKTKDIDKNIFANPQDPKAIKDSTALFKKESNQGNNHDDNKNNDDKEHNSQSSEQSIPSVNSNKNKNSKSVNKQEVWEASFPCFQWKEKKVFNEEKGKYIYTYVSNNGRVLTEEEAPKETGYIGADGRVVFPKINFLDKIYNEKKPKIFQVTNKEVQNKLRKGEQCTLHQKKEGDDFDDGILLNIASYY